MTGQVDRVIQIGAAGCALRNCSRRYHATTADGIHAGAANRAGERAGVLGEVSEQVDVEVEGHDHGFVFRAHHFAQESRSGVLFGVDHAVHAGAGIDQQAEGNRHVNFLGEESNFLLDAVLEYLEVVLGQVRNDAVMFVTHGGEHVDDGG